MDTNKIGTVWTEGTDYLIVTEVGIKRFDIEDYKEFVNEIKRVNKFLESEPEEGG